jgi:hypothetical protein
MLDFTNAIAIIEPNVLFSVVGSIIPANTMSPFSQYLNSDKSLHQLSDHRFLGYYLGCHYHFDYGLNLIHDVINLLLNVRNHLRRNPHHALKYSIALKALLTSIFLDSKSYCFLKCSYFNIDILELPMTLPVTFNCFDSSNLVANCFSYLR